jgi:hypothetical protein
MSHQQKRHKHRGMREDLFAPRKGKEPPVVKAVVHNPYNSPLQLYSTENVADTLAKQTEVLTEGHISAEEDEGPESLSFKEKSAVFQLLEEQAKQETSPITRGSPQRQTVVKPKAAPPPPPKPKPPSQELLYNGYDTTQRQVHQDHQKSAKRVEYQTTQKVVNQYQYQQEQPAQYQQTSVHQTSSYQKPTGFQSSVVVERSYSPGHQSPGINYQQRNYQQTYQQSNYQQPQSPQSPAVSAYQQPQQHPGYQSPVTSNYQPLNQVNYQQNRSYNSPQTAGYQVQVQVQTHPSQHKGQQSPTAVSKAEFKIGPPPPPRGSSAKQDTDNMTAIYKQQYEQHLHQYEEQQTYANHINGVGSPPKAHIIRENIFENNSTSGTPITYKAPPAAPPKPNWPPPPSPEQFRSPRSPSPATNMRAGSAWPPKKSTVTDLPRTGFNPAAVRDSGTGRRCVWPPQKEDEYRNGRTTPQSPLTGRRIQWNPSPSPPTSRKAAFGTSQSPIRRKDIQWPPASPTASIEREIIIRGSPRLSRKARFDDYIREHASINVPQTYRPPPGTQHVEYR